MRKGYSLDNSLLKGSGRNYGISLMLSKQTGPLTGWIGYTLQRSLRSSDDPALPAEYPSSHERIHELNATAIRSWNRWDLSASLVAASGIPFTAANSLYVQQNMLLCNFGQYNAERFKPYVRIDLSVNYYFSRSGDGRENGINFSLYNATGRKNDIFYRINYTEDARFNYSSMYYKIMFLPSIGYFHRF